VLYALFSWRGLSLLNASKREDYEAITNHRNDEDSKDTPSQDDNREDSSDESSSSSLLATIVLWRTYLLSLVLFTALINLVIEVQKANSSLNEFESIKDEFYLFGPDYEGKESDKYEKFSLVKNIGKLSIWSNGVLSTCVLIVGAGLSLYYRSNVKRSSTIIRWCITMVLIVKLWPSVVQMDAKFAYSNVINYYEDYYEYYYEYYDEEISPEKKAEFALRKAQLIASKRLSHTIESAVDIVPLIIAFPRGMLAAAMSIFALRPTATTPKILVMFFSPFATLLLILGASSIAQLAGEPFLATSLLCFFLKDVLVYFSFGDLLAGDIDAFISSKKAKARLCAGIIGIVFLIMWVFKHLSPCFDTARTYIGGEGKTADVQAADVQCGALALAFATQNLKASKFMGMAVRYFMVLFFSKLVMADLVLICLAHAEPLPPNDASDISFFIIDSAGNGEASKNDSNAKNDDVEAANTKRDALTKCRVTLANLAVTLSSALAKCRVALIDLAIKLGLTSAGNDEDNKNDSNAKNDDVEAGSNTKRDVLNNDPLTAFPVALSTDTNNKNAGNGEDNKNNSNAKNDDVEAANTKRGVLNNDPLTVFPVALSTNTNDNAGNSEDNKNDSNAKDDVEEATNSTTKDA
jgi:hypothetical protein